MRRRKRDGERALIVVCNVGDAGGFGRRGARELDSGEVVGLRLTRGGSLPGQLVLHTPVGVRGVDEGELR